MDEGIGGLPTEDSPLVEPAECCTGTAVATGKLAGMVWPTVVGGSQKGLEKSLLKVDTKCLV